MFNEIQKHFGRARISNQCIMVFLVSLKRSATIMTKYDFTNMWNVRLMLLYED